MHTYEFSVKKTLLGTFSVQAENRTQAEMLVKDHARRIVLVNNVSPWSYELVDATCIDTTEGRD